MANDLNRSIKIYIDSADAMDKYNKLTQSTEKLKKQLEELRLAGKKETDQYEITRRSLERDLKQRGAHINKIQETERVLKNLSGATYGELEQVRKALRFNLKKTERGTVEYTEKLRVLDSVQKELTIAQKEMNGTLGSQGSFFSRAANGFNKYFGIVTSGIAAVTGVSFALRKISQDAAKMDDVYADVMKTTGMTKEEVLDLNEIFKQMDTRTSREQLNMLARDAGKLGIQSKEDILGFVEAANQIQVALGEDLGEGAIREVGKMVDVFTKSTRELEGLDLKQKMLAVGSAINEIGATSSAQEEFLVQFAGRLGGVATQAGIGIDAVLGFASVLDQDMQQVEMSATALQQVIIKMMGDPAKFARLAGVEVSKFTQLVRTDANEAIKVLLRSLNERGGFQELVPLFDEMGLSGTRAVGVLSSLAGSIDKIDAAQRVANESMVRADGVTKEYNIKNNTMQAQLEKLRKSYNDTTEALGNRLNPAMLKSTNVLTYIIKSLPAVIDFFARFGGTIFKVTALIVAYNIALRAQNMWTELALVTKLKLIAANIKEQASMIALNLRYVAGSKNIAELNRSMKALFATLNINPWAIAITALTAVGILLYENARRTRDLTDAAKVQANINKVAAESIARERAELDLLLGTARNEKLSKEERRRAIIRLNEISPEYLGNLNLENINTQAATTSIDNYTTALKLNAQQKAISDKVSELYAKRVEKEADIAEQNARKQGAGSEIRNLADRKIESINKEIAAIDQQIKVYDTLNQKILENAKTTKTATTTSTTTNGGALPPGGSSTPGVPSKDTYQKALKSLDEYVAKEKSIIAKKYAEGKINQDQYNIELENLEQERYQKNLEIAALSIENLEAYIVQEKVLIQQKYVEGIISEEEYNRQLGYLEMERLRVNLEIAGLTFEQRQEIEIKIFETKKDMLKKIEDEERQHQNKILELQKAADKARAESNERALRKMAKDNMESWISQKQHELEKVNEYAGMAIDLSGQLGDILGQYYAGNEEQQKDAQKNMILLAIDSLEMIVKLAVAEATAKAFASGDPITGAIKTAAITAAITLAFSFAKSFVRSKLSKMGSDSSTSDSSVTGSRVVTQRAKGKYDVVGADDGRSYTGVPYVGLVQTGFVSTPTLMGEQGRELVVSAPDLVRLQRHINYPLIISAINDARAGSVPQRAAGNYSQVQQPITAAAVPNTEVLNRLTVAIEKLLKNGVRSAVVLSDIQREQYIHDTSRKIGSK